MYFTEWRFKEKTVNEGLVLKDLTHRLTPEHSDVFSNAALTTSSSANAANETDEGSNSDQPLGFNGG